MGDLVAVVEGQGMGLGALGRELAPAPSTAAVDEGGRDAVPEAMPLEGRPAALREDGGWCDEGGELGVHQHEVGEVALSDEAAAVDVEEPRWGVCHALDDELTAEEPFGREIEHGDERVLRQRASAGSREAVALLLAQEVGGMVGSDDIYEPRGYGGT